MFNFWCKDFVDAVANGQLVPPPGYVSPAKPNVSERQWAAEQMMFATNQYGSMDEFIEAVDKLACYLANGL